MISIFNFLTVFKKNDILFGVFRIIVSEGTIAIDFAKTLACKMLFFSLKIAIILLKRV